MIKYEILFKNKNKWSESQQKEASEKVIYFPTHTTPYNWSFPNPTTYFSLKMIETNESLFKWVATRAEVEEIFQILVYPIVFYIWWYY